METTIKSVPLVLGSASPRRSKILQTLGCAFEVCAVDADEIHDSADPVHTVVTNAAEKYRACRARCPAAAIIAADTLVWFEGRLIGKPADLEQAAAFLRAFSGRTQIVYTGVALGLPGAPVVCCCARARPLPRPAAAPTSQQASVRRCLFMNAFLRLTSETGHLMKSKDCTKRRNLALNNDPDLTEYAAKLILSDTSYTPGYLS